MASEIWVPLLTAIVGSIGTVLSIRYRHSLQLKREQAKCHVQEAVEQDTELLAKLEELRSNVGASRACIYQFHNGGEYYTGRSMQKFSMTYETVSKGISRNQTARQNVPVSACNETLSQLIKDRRLYYVDVKKEMPESLCKFIATEDGTKSMYKWAIYDLEKRALGYLQIDFVGKKKNLSEDDIQDLEMSAIKIAGYL